MTRDDKRFELVKAVAAGFNFEVGRLHDSFLCGIIARQTVLIADAILAELERTVEKTETTEGVRVWRNDGKMRFAKRGGAM